MRKRNIQKKIIRRVIGIHSCLEVLKVRPKQIRSIYVQENWKNNNELKLIIQQAKKHRIDFFEQSKQQLSSWGPGNQGVALIVEDSPQSSLSKESIFIFIDGLEDPRNLGAVLRTSWLMGVKTVFLSKKGSIRHITSSVSKSASGGAEHVAVEFLSRPHDWIKQMKKEGFVVYGLEKTGSYSLWKENFEKKIILVAGSEARGLKTKTKLLCDRLIHIPQKSNSGNYNLSVSIALALGRIFFN